MLHENEQSGLAPSSSSWSLLFSWGPANMAEASTTSSSASSSFVYDIIPKVALSEGSVILGIPIRKDSFVEKGWMRRSRNSKAQTLKSNVVKFLLRRTSFGACRVNHVLRSLQFRHGKAVASKSAALFQHGLADAIGSELPDVKFTYIFSSSVLHSFLFVFRILFSACRLSWFLFLFLPLFVSSVAASPPP